MSLSRPKEKMSSSEKNASSRVARTVKLVRSLLSKKEKFQELLEKDKQINAPLLGGDQKQEETSSYFDELERSASHSEEEEGLKDAKDRKQEDIGFSFLQDPPFPKERATDPDLAAPSFSFPPPDVKSAFPSMALADEKKAVSVAHAMSGPESISSLISAAGKGDLGEIEALLKAGANVNGRNKKNTTALFEAVRAPTSAAFEYLVRAGADLTALCQEHAMAQAIALGRWPLKEKAAWLARLAKKNIRLHKVHQAATLGDVDFFKERTEAKDDAIFIKGLQGETALHYASANGHLAIEQLLIKARPGLISEKSTNGETALLVAAYNGQLETVQWLLTEGGASLSEKDNGGATALLAATYYDQFETVQWLLIEGGASLSEKNNNGSTALHLAASDGRLATMEWLLGNGASLGEKDKHGFTALQYAALNGHLATVKWLFEQGASLVEKSKYGSTALHFAAGDGHLAIVEWLFKQSVGLAEKDIGGNTALLWATNGGHLAIVEWLLKNGAALSEKNKDGRTVLYLAAQNSKFEIVQWLLSTEPTLATIDKEGSKMALFCAARNGHLDTVQCLLKSGVGLADKDIYGNTALLLAAGGGHLATVEWLFKQGASLTDKNINNDTALLLAARGGHLATVKWLFKHGTKFKSFWRERPSRALLLAAENGHLATVEWLFKQGASLTERNSRGDTALDSAAHGGHLATVKWLFKHGAKLAEKSFWGERPSRALLLAAENGHLATVEWLFKQDASLTGKNILGEALQSAVRGGHLATVEWLFKQGASLTGKNIFGTALHSAAYGGHLATVEWLYKQGASLTEKNNEGATALHSAAYGGHLATVEWLINQGASLVDKNKYGLTALLVAACCNHLTIVERLIIKHGASFAEINTDAHTVILKARRSGYGNDYRDDYIIMQACLNRWVVLYDAIKNKKKVDIQLKALQAILKYNPIYGDYNRSYKKVELDSASARLLLASPCLSLLTHEGLADSKEEVRRLFAAEYAERTENKEGGRCLALHRSYWDLPKIQALLSYMKEQSIISLTITNSIWPTDESWGLFIKEIGTLPLKHLDLSACQLSDIRLIALAKVLSGMPALTTCRLNKNYLSYRGFRDFMGDIYQHPGLKELSLRENRIQATNKKEVDQDIGTLLRQEEKLPLRQLDVTGNYFMSRGHDPQQPEALRLLLKATGLSAKEFSETEWVREKKSERPFHTVLRLSVNGDERDFEVPNTTLSAFLSYRDTNKLGTDAKAFEHLQTGLDHSLRLHPELRPIRLSEIDEKALNEQKKACKSLFFYHPDAPFKSYLQSHPKLRTERLAEAQCLLDPHFIVTPHEWSVYFVAKGEASTAEMIKGRQIKEHVMLAWEGVYSYGQRVIKVAELTVGKKGLLESNQPTISYFDLAIEKIDSFRKGHVWAAFKASKTKVKEMEKAIDKEVEDLPGKYKKTLGNSGLDVSLGVSLEDEEKIMRNCQQWALEKLESCLDLPSMTLQHTMNARPSQTVAALLRAHPEARKAGQGLFDQKAEEGLSILPGPGLETDELPATQRKKSCLVM